MMRGCLKAVAAFGLVGALAAPSMAQGPGGFGGGPGQGGVMMLANPGVQKELKLDENQVEKVNALAAETREKMTAIRDKVSDLQGHEQRQKMQELARPIQEEAMKSAATFLKPEQVVRFKQITLQQRGANALSDPAVAKQLGVTPEQQEKARTILDASQSEMREIFQSAGDDRQAAMQKVQALRKETNAKVMALMTDDQKKTWKEMTGEPFEYTPGPRPAR